MAETTWDAELAAISASAASYCPRLSAMPVATRRTSVSSSSSTDGRDQRSVPCIVAESGITFRGAHVCGATAGLATVSVTAR